MADGGNNQDERITNQKTVTFANDIGMAPRRPFENDDEVLADGYIQSDAHLGARKYFRLDKSQIERDETGKPRFKGVGTFELGRVPMARGAGPQEGRARPMPKKMQKGPYFTSEKPWTCQRCGRRTYDLGFMPRALGKDPHTRFCKTCGYDVAPTQSDSPGSRSHPLTKMEKPGQRKQYPSSVPGPVMTETESEQRRKVSTIWSCPHCKRTGVEGEGHAADCPAMTDSNLGGGRRTRRKRRKSRKKRRRRRRMTKKGSAGPPVAPKLPQRPQIRRQHAYAGNNNNNNINNNNNNNSNNNENVVGPAAAGAADYGRVPRGDAPGRCMRKLPGLRAYRCIRCDRPHGPIPPTKGVCIGPGQCGDSDEWGDIHAINTLPPAGSGCMPAGGRRRRSRRKRRKRRRKTKRRRRIKRR